METLEAAQETPRVEKVRLTGKVTKINPASRYGFIADSDRVHYFFHLTECPGLRSLPPVGSWVTFTVVPEGSTRAGRKKKSDRAIRVEVI